MKNYLLLFKEGPERPSASDGPITIRLLLLAVTLTALFGVFFLVARPWYLQWGAAEDETRKVLPGDEIIPNALNQSTRAITIDAPIEAVWPWVAQLGQDRGGFYSYDVLENLVGCEMSTTDYLRPEKQSWHLGDKLWMYPSNKSGGIGFALVLRTKTLGEAIA
jgi:hypothetical protein